MKKKRSPGSLFGKKRALALSVTISFLLNFILIQGIFYGLRRGIWGPGDPIALIKFFTWHFCCNIALFYLLFMFNFRIIRSQLKAERIPWTAALGTLLICAVISPVLAKVQQYALGFDTEIFIVFNASKDIISGSIVILIAHNTYSNYKREQTFMANQRLKEENIKVHFEALKNQLDPHFLFNSLNTLDGLIGIDDEKAHEYVGNLSAVFRYTLYNKHIVTLTEEIAFVESYVALLKLRYGDNLRVHYDIDEQLKSRSVMPVSIQLLVENAVKHNVISNKTPLTIDIRTTPHRGIVVSNRINPKTEKSVGGGVGLANLADRYSMIFGENITITDTEGVFAVHIPLIEENRLST